MLAELKQTAPGGRFARKRPPGFFCPQSPSRKCIPVIFLEKSRVLWYHKLILYAHHTRAVGSCLTNKYSEGYPAGHRSGNRGRYYGGCGCVDELEEYCCGMWQQVFGTDYHVNVQPHSGSSANLAAYMSVLKPGDTILAMSLNNGGHLTHGSPVNFSGKLYNMVFYGVDDRGFIDYDDMRRKASAYRPQLILAGASAYSRIIDFGAFAAAAQEVGAYFMVDMAHIAGLVAAGDHPSPFGLADIITTTTHKTLRGTRGGLIFCRPELAKQVDSAVFPGI